MKNYNVLLKEIENLLQTISKQKAADIKDQQYMAAAQSRDQEREILANTKELLMEMKIDLDGMDPDSSEKLELLKVYQNYMKEFGFDNTKRIEALRQKNEEMDAMIETLRQEKAAFLKAEQFGEANRVRDKMIELQEERSKNVRELRSMQGF